MIKPRSAIAGMSVGAALLVAVLQQEGYTDKAIIPVPGDVPTIGAGRTEGVKMGDTTNTVREMVYLLNNLEGKYAAGVKRCVTAPLSQDEFDVYVSFAYNVGVANFCSSSMRAYINQGEYGKACGQLVMWVYGPSKKVIPGLVNRRIADYQKCVGVA